MNEGINTDAPIREARRRVNAYLDLGRAYWRHRLADQICLRLVGVSLVDWVTTVQDQDRSIEANRRGRKRSHSTRVVLARQRDECMRDLYLKGEPFDAMVELSERFEAETKLVQDGQGALPPYLGPERSWPDCPWRK